MILECVIVRKDEDISGLKKCLDMFAMQRKVNFSDFVVTIVQVGREELNLDKYPFRIVVRHSDVDTLSKIYNSCILLSESQWIMFMDYGDTMADVYSLNIILDLFPTEEFDILWLQYYAEYRARNGELFVNVIENPDNRMNAKMFRKNFLMDNNIRFDESITHDEGEVFLATAKSVTEYSRFAKIGTKFLPYVRAEQPVPDDAKEETIIFQMHTTNMAVVRNTRLHTMGNMYMQAVMRAMCNAYYFLHMKYYPVVTKQIENDISALYKQNAMMIDSMKEDDIEVFIDESDKFVLNMIQNAYINYGYQMMYDTDVESFSEWVKNGCKAYDINKATLVKPEHSKRIHGSNNDRVAVFCGTRNVYDSMETAAKSLMLNTRMDRVYFLIEDDTFPRSLPDNFIVINMSGQKYFDPHGKNYNNAWTYMCLLRAAFTKIMPTEHKVLSLDVDVIVNKNISELWDIDLSKYYLAGVPETEKTQKNKTPYVNFGIIMMNLDRIRETHIDDTIIDSLNRSRWGCPEQDAFNHFCSGEIYPLPNMYNVTRAGSITGNADVEKISHYAGIKYWSHFKPFRMYQQMTWDEIIYKSVKPVLFVSFRPLERAENLLAIYHAYNGPKKHICTHDANYKAEVQSGKYDLMVIDEFPTVSPGKCIMIWHGIQGGKTIGLDQPHPYYRLSDAKLMTYIVTPGTGTIGMWHSCTGVPEKNILPLGMPRTDEYIGKKKGDGGTVLAQKIAYLYVPTFRNSNETKFPDIDWDLIDSQLDDDELFVIKAHPQTRTSINKSYKHIIEISNTEATAPYLYDCDAVVTDYSSIMFDAYLLNIPVVLFEKKPGYTETRGMYMKYPDQYCSRYAINELGMLTLLRTSIGLGLNKTERDCLNIVADKCDGHSCERICKLIDDLNKGGE